jgi:poly(hydroxyalkanoate) depolymerase family esterase
VKRALVAAVVVVLLVAPSASGRPSTRSSFVRIEGARNYWVYTPSGTAPKQGRPMVVYLHGCTQTDADAAAAGFGTGWNALAEREGIVVVYPMQAEYRGGVDGNGAACWNWFLPPHQQRDAGEPALIADITRAVAASHQVDPRRIYVTGVSAGADMSVVMGATYPDLYAAIGVFAGCAYLTCTDVTGAAAYQAMGPRARAVPAIAFQGTADPLNDPAMAETLVPQQLGTADWVDDGAANGSVPRTPATVEHHRVDGSMTDVDPSADPADACVESSHWPCPAGALGWDEYPFTVRHYVDAAGRPLLDHWLIHGLSHNHPDADGATFTDPAGPDVTAASWAFFAAHPMPVL